jgi:hypothetical protein
VACSVAAHRLRRAAGVPRGGLRRLRRARTFIPARARARPAAGQVRGASDEFAFVLYFGFDEADPIYDRRAPEARGSAGAWGGWRVGRFVLGRHRRRSPARAIPAAHRAACARPRCSDCAHRRDYA